MIKAIARGVILILEPNSVLMRANALAFMVETE
jgi:hypothetical protein